MEFHYIEPENTSQSESEQDARVVVGIGEWLVCEYLYLRFRKVFDDE